MRTILVVDDNDDLRPFVAQLLRDAGYQVATARHGLEALEILDRMVERPCLVLLDCVMPVMSGPEFMAVLRKGHRLAPLPVVVMSATANENEVPGALKFIRKPATLRVLMGVVEEFCGLAEAGGFAREQNSADADRERAARTVRQLD